MLERPKLFGNLLTKVVRSNFCTFCGACMAACPINALWPAGEEPTFVGACALCEICYYQCPTIEFSNDDAEMYLFNRTRQADELIGITNGVFIGKATRNEVQAQTQDGGVVTAPSIQEKQNQPRAPVPPTT